MRLDFAVLALSLMTSASASAINEQHEPRVDVLAGSDEHDLYKRKGGGGGGGRGGGGGGSRGGSSGGSRGGSSGGSRGGSGGSNSGNRGGSSGSPPAGARPGSNVGGTSPGGTGPQPRFGPSGGFYGGGARAPFQAGRSARNGAGLATTGLLLGGALAFWPGLWLAGAYLYPYHNDYRFHNDTSDKEEELPVICGCARYNPCSCDEGDNSTVYLDELVGNGSYADLNKSIIDTGERDGKKVILINGTLPNGTTAKEGDADADADADGDSAGNSLKSHLETLGYWPVVATVAAIVFAA